MKKVAFIIEVPDGELCYYYNNQSDSEICNFFDNENGCTQCLKGFDNKIIGGQYAKAPECLALHNHYSS